jgi:membrane protease YdiL (CAAX protease family)
MPASEPASAANAALAPPPLPPQAAVPPPRLGAVLGHAALDFALAVAIVLALSMTTMMAWAFARGLQVAMRQPGSTSTTDALQAIGEPGALAQLSMALIAVGGAALAVYLLRRRAGREERAASWRAARRPATWGWALGVGLVAFGLSAALSWAGEQFGIEPVPSNVQMIEAALRSQFALTLLFAVVAAPAYEELLFRRVLFGRFWAAGLPGLGIVLSSLAFALVHEPPGLSGNGPGAIVLLWLTYAAIGASFAWVYRRTGTLWAPIAAHGVNNLLACALLYLHI